MRLSGWIGLASFVLAAAGCASTSDDTADTSGALSRPRTYLALGDSLAFGPNPDVPHFTDARAYHAYPEDLASELGTTLVNASCPGQTTSGYLSRSGPDLACFHNLDAGLPLKVRWDAPTQRDFAIRTLKSGADVRLVTLQLGANDLVSTMFTCGSAYTGCSASSHYTEIPGALLTAKSNLRRILLDLRSVYRGPLVVVNYYSTHYDDLFTTSAIRLLNAAIRDEAEKDDVGALVADVFTEMQDPSESSKGDLCAAGLLARNPDCSVLDPTSPTYPYDFCHSGLRVDPHVVPCDNHPSARGHAAISAAVLKVLDDHGVEL